MRTPEMQQNDFKQYILSHFAEALNKHWIELYVQPVVRTFTGNICAFEGLARWNDPVYGLLPPGRFIPVLEKARLIHKLDMHMLELICRSLRCWIDTGHPMLPVSFNLSRLDFDAMDVFAAIENMRRKYDIPRDLLRIEITESIIAQTGNRVIPVINLLRSSGYDVWMDDFGSGYSSLNILNQVDVDLLKLDMEFLHHFTKKSRQIIVTLINMAKRLHMRTLAEGVETEKQLEFLREIGCDRAQGFLFSQPLPWEQVMKKMESQGRIIESRRWRYYYDAAGNAVRESSQPLALLEYDGEKCTLLHSNAAYEELMSSLDDPIHASAKQEFHEKVKKNLYQEFLGFLAMLRKQKETDSFFYSSGSDYIKIQGRFLAEMDGRSLYQLKTENITRNTERLEQVKLDKSLRTLYYFYDSIDLVDYTKGHMEPLFSYNSQYWSLRSYLNNLPALTEKFTSEWVLREDRERYRMFMDFATQQQRLKNSPKGLLADRFRVRNKDGSFGWKEVAIMQVAESDGNQALITLRSIPYGDSQRPAEPVMLTDRTIPDAVLWNQLMRSTALYYFWKDRKRRFLGASQSFLDVYGITSLEDILGKTDEDMGWYVDGDRFREDEWAVLEEGCSFWDVDGECIIKGRIRHVSASKWPVYDHGQIVGLMGLFYDVDDWRQRMDAMLHQSCLDPVTGLMNQHGFADALLNYEERWCNQKQGYGVILCQNLQSRRILDSFGEEMNQKVLRKQADCLRDQFGNRAVLARLGESRYGVSLESENLQEMERRAREIVEDLDGIHRVRGNEVIMDFVAVTAHSSEPDVQGELLYQKARKRLAARIGNGYGAGQ